MSPTGLGADGGQASGAAPLASPELEHEREPRVAVVGASLRSTCGVRDHARLLAAALEQEGVACSWHWLQREQTSLGASRAEMGAWTAALASELERERPDAILLHYSVFAFSHKGIPLFVPQVLAALGASGAPVLTVLHEFAYPWRYGGWRGTVWALTQRALVAEVVRRSGALIVTSEVRSSWLQSRRWLPRRPVVVAPVFSNLPPPAAQPPRDRAEPVVGLFGYSYQGAAVALILDAIGAVVRGGTPVRLLLLGAPGPDSSAGEEWRRGARERDIGEALSFTGALPAQELSNGLAECDLLLFADAFGPSPRKGTLAGALASGRPVVAIDGPMTWQALLACNAAQVVPAAPGALADAIARLLEQDEEREGLGARGRAFYEREMAVERTAAATLSLLGQIRSTP